LPAGLSEPSLEDSSSPLDSLPPVEPAVPEPLLELLVEVVETDVV
jgi:hypothetical protein